ncbi:uncharacterized protein LOC115241990 [Formica exsecta]|uniref:uncharacterized protein LOC115241990 n=1 Tax=Formica exsecta TaxID=72781 RepID=UPI001143D0F8|nr:uncharacterized protein LOC115241990 [Formica exsecta]
MTDFTPDEWERLMSATHCRVCEKPFESEDARVHDHCHLTGRYRDPAHSNCNLNYKETYVIPVFFHNLSGYDARFIIKDVANAFPGSVELLPLTKETYISFAKNVEDASNEGWFGKRLKFRFVDSFKFLSASLEKLASYLDKSELRIARSEFSDLDDADFELLARKGVFPYEYVDDVDKLLETRLPPREAFHSSLTGDVISESDYARAIRVWERFRVETLGDYSDLYLKTDVLLLADVFENFRDACMRSYNLDPTYYYMLLGYTWDAMLKHTGIRFELLTDIDMVMFVERGGLSRCSNKYARANNKYLQTYDPSESSAYLMYFDINNLYGWAMSQSLPYEDFRWVDDVASVDLISVTSNSPIGYILEVDLAYPSNLHDSHADLPFCPTRDKPPGKRDEKLLATLYDMSRYMTYYRNLQQCVRHGLRVMRIHRILQFAQSPWLRGYIELNTRLRINAKNEFEKNLYKLMNNAVFAVELRKLEIKFNKPVYVGMCILDVFKIRLYEFLYEYMLPLYRDKCEIMYIDTDSLIYRIECEDVYEDMKRDIDRFDTSDYAVDNAYGMPLANKKIPGAMKDENSGAIMTEFVGLRAKMYALLVDSRNDTKRIKGVKSGVVARTITFEDYARCLRRRIEMRHEQSCIRSKLHEVYTVSELKVALSPHDDKRYVIWRRSRALCALHYRAGSNTDNEASFALSSMLDRILECRLRIYNENDENAYDTSELNNSSANGL